MTCIVIWSYEARNHTGPFLVSNLTEGIVNGTYSLEIINLVENELTSIRAIEQR